MLDLTPDQFRQLLEKIYAMYFYESKKSEKSQVSFDRVNIDGQKYKIGYSIHENTPRIDINISKRG